MLFNHLKFDYISKGSHIRISKLRYTSVIDRLQFLNISLSLIANIADPAKIPFSVEFHLGIHCWPSVTPGLQLHFELK